MMSSSGKLLVPDEPLAPPLAAILSDGSQLMERGALSIRSPRTARGPPPCLSLVRSLVRSFGSVRSLVRLVLPHRRSCRRRCRLLLPSPIPSAPGPAACVASVATATHTAVYGNAVTGSRSSRTSAHLPVSSSTRLQSHIDDDKIFIRFLIAVFRELINDYSFLFFFYI